MKRLILSLVFAGSAFCVSSTPVVVTADATLGGHDVVARVNNQAATVASWRAVKDVELWILIDDGTSSVLGVQLRDLQDFIRREPAEIKIGIGYLRNGTVQKVQAATGDREAAAKALRLPTGIPGISGSPYIALADFLHHLPAATLPREVVLISSGIDPYYGPGPENPYLLNAIHDSQKQGVPIYSIYFSGAGRASHSYRQIDWGQNDLSELSEETGGVFYWEGTANPVALQPFLKDIGKRLGEQYIMEVETTGGHSGFESLGLKTEGQPAKLTGPREVYVH
jgi:hypothetical protein